MGTGIAVDTDPEVAEAHHDWRQKLEESDAQNTDFLIEIIEDAQKELTQNILEELAGLQEQKNAEIQQRVEQRLIEVEKRVEETLEEHEDRLSEIETELDGQEEDLDEERIEKLEDRLEQIEQKIAKPETGNTLNPVEVAEDLVGEEVRVKGELEFKKQVAGNNFYKLSGGDGVVVVRSETRIPEGKRILKGEVEDISGNICISVE